VVANSGFNGLGVVFALRKDLNADTEKHTPISQLTKMQTILTIPIKFGVLENISHISTPKNKATIGGGILFSRRILLTYHV
jgi:hypothetical protein